MKTRIGASDRSTSLLAAAPLPAVAQRTRDSPARRASTPSRWAAASISFLRQGDAFARRGRRRRTGRWPRSSPRCAAERSRFAARARSGFFNWGGDAGAVHVTLPTLVALDGLGRLGRRDRGHVHERQLAARRVRRQRPRHRRRRGLVGSRSVGRLGHALERHCALGARAIERRQRLERERAHGRRGRRPKQRRLGSLDRACATRSSATRRAAATSATAVSRPPWTSTRAAAQTSAAASRASKKRGGPKAASIRTAEPSAAETQNSKLIPTPTSRERPTIEKS